MVSQTSERLKPHSWLAMPTAMPWLAELLTKARTKSANIVGQTMRLNPHGDAAIYDTMVRLSKGCLAAFSLAYDVFLSTVFSSFLL